MNFFDFSDKKLEVSFTSMTASEPFVRFIISVRWGHTKINRRKNIAYALKIKPVFSEPDFDFMRTFLQLFPAILNDCVI